MLDAPNRLFTALFKMKGYLDIHMFVSTAVENFYADGVSFGALRPAISPKSGELNRIRQFFNVMTDAESAIALHGA